MEEQFTSEEIARLSPPARLALIAQIWNSLEEDQLPLTQAQQKELDHRLSSLDVDKSHGVSWSALQAELEQLCP